MLGPRYRPKAYLVSGNGAFVSLNFTHSYHSCCVKGDMLGVCPETSVSGTSPFSSKMSCAVWAQIVASNMRQWSHNFRGALLLSIFLPKLFFNSLMAPSAALAHGE